MEEFVNVSVRIRPPIKEEISPCLQVINTNPAVLLVTDKSQMYHFDNIFTDESTQTNVYECTVKNLVEKVKKGYNSTIFAYGQTGTGKTYTIGTNPVVNDPAEMGLISRTLEDFFVNDDSNQISISFIEIYNEKVFDLFGFNTHTKVPLSVKGFKVQGFNQITVSSSREAIHYLKIGSSKRHTGGTKQNSKSSRSHAIFSIYCLMQNGESETLAKLNLVDLAGSESVRKTGNRGSSFYEGININKGLLSLGQVMTALSTNSSHVPYRQSVVTTILQDSLNKKNFVSLIACVSSNSEDLGETLQTLEFSNRVKRMKSKPEVNEFMVQYKKDNSALFASTKGQTPMKRTNDFSYETPFKKPKNVLPVIREPLLVNNSLDVSSLSSSNMTSTSNDPSQNFSPVIRKYMSAMEASIMSRLEDVIKSTIKRPNKVKTKWDKENITLNTSYEGISDDSIDVEACATSSPDEALTTVIGGEETLKPKKLYLHTSNVSLVNESQPDLNDFVFKVPETIKKHVRRSNARSETKFSPKSRRRSVRLQMKNNVNVNSESGTNTRRSVRILAKKDKSNSQTELKERSQKNKRVTATPCITCVNKKTSNLSKSSPNSRASPMTKRTKEVLQILNCGTLREIEKLHTVGPKTAEKFLLYRQVNGCFKSISEMSEMPYWTRKKYDKFVAENFIRE